MTAGCVDRIAHATVGSRARSPVVTVSTARGEPNDRDRAGRNSYVGKFYRSERQDNAANGNIDVGLSSSQFGGRPRLHAAGNSASDELRQVWLPGDASTTIAASVLIGQPVAPRRIDFIPARRRQPAPSTPTTTRPQLGTDPERSLSTGSSVRSCASHSSSVPVLRGRTLGPPATHSSSNICEAATSYSTASPRLGQCIFDRTSAIAAIPCLL